MKIPVETKNKDGSYNQHYWRYRLAFIKYCIKKGLSYSEIGKLLGITKQRIYAIYRYGLKNLTPAMKKDRIEKDKNKCRICQKRKNLIVHHIGNPKDQSRKNLMTLCRSCHAKLHHVLKKHETSPLV